jgi:predicted RNase H-like HicB family nuclease
MQKTFSAITFVEDGWHIAQCLELDIASQGNDTAESLLNLQEALTLHMMAPCSTQIGEYCKSTEEALQLVSNACPAEITVHHE